MDGTSPGHGPASRYTETESPSWAMASSHEVAGGRPDTLALLTASGPVLLSSSSATGCSGIRTATVPLVSPRSQTRVGLDRQMMVSAPGQNSSIRSFPAAPRSMTSAMAARTVPTSTGGGMSRPRPLALSRPSTATGSKASAAIP